MDKQIQSHVARNVQAPYCYGGWNRRSMLKGAAFGLVTLGRGLEIESVLAGEQQPTPSSPLIRTTAGKVRGYIANGVYTFKGIPYGDSTVGPNRFCPAQRPRGWAGILAATEYGPIATQSIYPDDSGELSQLWAGLLRTRPTVSENCLVLNVWTPALGTQNKLPVMVWLHGGGFGAGSGDWGWTDGTNLARRNGVVVVSLNHRLNIFGHLYLGDIGGRKYAESGNVGMLDIVLALEWVRENIRAFGGDPDSVTVFGQSGGGCKVNVLMAMPAARGLFHKAIQMSGPCPKMLSREQASQTTLLVLKHLDIATDEIDRLQHVPTQHLLQAMSQICKQSGFSESDDTWRDGTWFHMFDPVVDGLSLPRHPFDPTAPEVSTQVPMMLGTTAEDSRLDAGLPTALDASLDTLDEAGLRKDLQALGFAADQANELITGYRARRPNASPRDLFVAIASDVEYRKDAITMAERKEALRGAPAFMYLFTWESPAFGGKYKCSHGFDLPFVFDNLERAPGLLAERSGDPRASTLASRISKAWVAFARTGDPNHPGLPTWPAYESKQRATMVLNYSCELVNDPRGMDRLAVEKLTSPDSGKSPA